MPFYSDLASVRVRQIAADTLAAVVAVVAVVLGWTVGGLIGGLAEVGRRIEAAGDEFTGAMTEAGSALGGLPLVGDAVATPFDRAGASGAALAQAARDQQELAGVLAVAAGVAVAGIPLLMLVLVWLRPRLRFARRAAGLRALRSQPGGADLLALRALAEAPARDVLAAHPRAVDAWRAGDPDAVLALSALTLRRAGLRSQ